MFIKKLNTNQIYSSESNVSVDVHAMDYLGTIAETLNITGNCKNKPVLFFVVLRYTYLFLFWEVLDPNNIWLIVHNGTLEYVFSISEIRYTKNRCKYTAVGYILIYTNGNNIALAMSKYLSNCFAII